MIENLFQNKRGEHFKAAIVVIALSVFVSIFAFITEDNSITGFAVEEENKGSVVVQDLIEFDDVSSLGSLGVGNYFITNEGIVYWTDNEPIPVAKVKNLHEIQKNRKIYIDSYGNIGYLLE